MKRTCVYNKIGDSMKTLHSMMEFAGETMNTDLLTVSGDVYESYLGMARNIVYKTPDLVHVKIVLEETKGLIEVFDSEFVSKVILVGNGVSSRDMIRQFHNQYISPMRDSYRYLLTFAKDNLIRDVTNIYVPVDEVTRVHGDNTMLSDDMTQMVLTIPKDIHHIIFHHRMEIVMGGHATTCEIHENLNGVDVYSTAFTGFPYQEPPVVFVPEAIERFNTIMRLNAAFKKPRCTEWVDVTYGYRI